MNIKVLDLLGLIFKPSLLALGIDKVKCLLCNDDAVVAALYGEDEVVDVAEKCCVISEEQANQLLHHLLKRSGLRTPPCGIPFSS